MKKTIIILAVAAVAVGAWLILRPRAVAPEDDVKPVAQVRVVPLTVQRIVESLQAFGILEPAPSGARTVTLAYDAVVLRVDVSQGAAVAYGDTLLEIEAAPDARLELAAARGAARLADQGLEAARQRFDLKLATRQDLFAAEQAAEDAKAKLSSLTDRGMSGDGKLLAPVAGVVTRLDVQPGMLVPAGTALVSIAGTAQLEAHLAIEAADASKVHKDQPVEVAPSDRPDAGNSMGSVRQVGSAVDPVSGAVDVRVTLPAGKPWFAGEHVRGTVHTKEKVTLVAKRAAVLPDGDQQVLFTVQNNKAVRHVVHIGISGDDAVEVDAGDLHAGDSSVVVGNYELEDGMSVEVLPEDAKPDTKKTP